MNKTSITQEHVKYFYVRIDDALAFLMGFREEVKKEKKPFSQRIY